MDAPSWLQAAAVLVVLSIALGIQRRREAIRHKIRVFFFHILFPTAMYLVAVASLLQAGRSQVEAVAIGLLVLVFFALLAERRVPRRRTRHIPRSERNKAIARFERETGEKYDPRQHDVDHTIPFSRGGSSTADNLRVIDKSKNRSKGARSPWWDLLGGRSRR